MMHFIKVAAALSGLAFIVSASPAAPVELLALQSRATKHNDFSCKPSADHPNPVVLLHGLGATYYEDINFLEAFLQSKGFCTYSLTYGAYDGFPLVGGLKPIDESSHQIADLINEVHAKTGANKIDIVGHSEGGFQSLYVPKFREGISSLVDHIVAIAPPTHGTTFANLLNLLPLFGKDARENLGEILEKVGCAPCNEISTGGPSIAKLNDGKPIVQPGNKVTVITSKHDELVTPTTTSFIQEDGVNNIYIQDYCKSDPAGHIGEAYDTNVWNLVLNSLEDQVGRKFLCLAGPPVSGAITQTRGGLDLENPPAVWDGLKYKMKLCRTFSG
ncbi:uncharacterized protein LMH87_008441 [Akanthomyces muscarius]|uniref:AB hydrolase-1 domain-containing protein n=1 Tax=Akanthomyces muscarius TaxID=2231603 RepID=A0A9W8QLP2_AKAMU|nr:uncharacterized protein LMH87_008441 [Akanthomyces muscarius]KAJ4159543.1 hypothetical protein LMH87_008441 [Akanthomyces muscarius]